MKFLFSMCVLAPALVACAVNDRLGIPYGAPHQVVLVDGVSFSVVESPEGTWQAVHTDFLANNAVVSPNEFLARKVQFTRAIEAVSKCRVTDSVADLGYSKLQATVKC